MLDCSPVYWQTIVIGIPGSSLPCNLKVFVTEAGILYEQMSFWKCLIHDARNTCINDAWQEMTDVCRILQEIPWKVFVCVCNGAHCNMYAWHHTWRPLWLLSTIISSFLMYFWTEKLAYRWEKCQSLLNSKVSSKCYEHKVACWPCDCIQHFYSSWLRGITGNPGNHKHLQPEVIFLFLS